MKFLSSSLLPVDQNALSNVNYSSFLEETDSIDREVASYPRTSFLSDVGGAAGLVFGINIMGNGFGNNGCH